MAKFVLTAQLRLQAPKNVQQVVNQIQSGVGAVNIPVNIQNAAQAQKTIQNVTKATNQATKSADAMGKAFGVSLRRFTTFSIASRAIGLFSSKLSSAIDDAIEFQRQMVRLEQVTGDSAEKLAEVSKQITNLSTSLGISSRDLQGVTTILAQAGLKAADLENALNALAKTALAPTFGDIADTAEGAVAILAQFQEGTAALEAQLGAINEVSARFAVESEDLISVIRRTGGVFKASGGSLEELLALFTSIRATTREGAESIATGLRTILTRIQRPKTIQFLRQFGVELEDLNGKFIGPYKAVEQLSGALAGLEQGDIKFITIAEELGGFRQIGKVIPLLQQFGTAEEALAAAMEGRTSLQEDLIVGQKALAVQFTKVKEEFLSLVRGFTETTSFQILVKTTLNLASALIQLADSFKPVLPLLTAFAAIKFARGVGGFLGNVGAGFAAKGFASGGIVPGSGNQDTVPAMLTPGEFVVRKSSVKKIGAKNLAKMNKGGVVTRNLGYIDSDILSDPANADIVRKEMEKLGITNIPDYKMYLSTMAANARKSGDITKYKAIAAMAGAGKSYLMLGGKNAKDKDNALLRKTNRFPILTPDDISRSNEVVDTTATITKDKLEGWLKDADRVYALSTSTKEEQDELRRRRGIRDETGVNLFGRKAGTTKKAPLDSGEMESLLESEIEPGKLTVLGIRKDKPLRRKGADERVDAVKKKIGLFYGSFSPTTVGHQSMMDAATAVGVSPQDFLVLIGSNEGLKTTDPHSFRTAIFDQDFRAILAQAGFGSRGAMVSKKITRDFGIPKSMEISPTARGQRRFIVPESGSLAMVAAKDDKANKKYTDAGYKVQDVPRDEGSVSGSLAREAILSGNVNEMKRLLSPEVFEVIQNNLKQLRNRAEILPRIIESVRRKEVASLNEIEAMLAKLPSRIDKKKVAADPDYARQAEEVLELRKRRDKIKSAASFKPFDIVSKLAKRYPEKYGLGTMQYFANGGMVPGTGNRDTVPAMLTPGEFVIRKSSVEKIGAENLAMMNKGGPVVIRMRNKTSKGLAPIGQVAIQDINSERTAPTGKVGSFTKNVKKTDLLKILGRKTARLTDEEAKQEQKVKFVGNVHFASPDFKDSESQFSKEFIRNSLKPVDNQIKKIVKSISNKNANPRPISDDIAAVNAISGYAFESFLSGLADVSAEGGAAAFDFVLNDKQRKALEDFTENDPLPNLVDAKASFKAAGAILKKGVDYKVANPATNLVSFKTDQKLQELEDSGELRRRIRDINAKNLTPEQIRRKEVKKELNKLSTEELVKRLYGRGKYFGGYIRRYNEGGNVEPLSEKEIAELKKLGSARDVAKLVFGPTNIDPSKVAMFKPNAKAFSPADVRKALAKKNAITEQAEEKKTALPTYGGAFLVKTTSPEDNRIRTTRLASGNDFEYMLKTAFVDQSDASRIENDIVAPQLLSVINSVSSVLSKSIAGQEVKDGNIPNRNGITGSIFEAALSKAVNQNLNESADDNRTFDFPFGLGQLGVKVFGQEAALLAGVPTDAKINSSADSMKSIREKVQADATRKGFNRGGDVGSDTVPALLTPGEFVVNKTAAQRIGYGNLDRMNKQGVARFASGGVVGVQKFANGTGPTGVKSQIANLAGSADYGRKIVAVNTEIKKTGDYLKRLQGSIQKQTGATDRLYQESNALYAQIERYDQALVKIAKQQGKAEATGTAANRIIQMKIEAETKRIEVENKTIKAEQALQKLKEKEQTVTGQQNVLMEKRNALLKSAKADKQAATQLVYGSMQRSPQPPGPPGPSGPSGPSKSPVSSQQKQQKASKNSDSLYIQFAAFSGAVNTVGSSLSQLAQSADGSSTALSRVIDTSLGLINQITAVVLALQVFGLNLNLKSFSQIKDVPNILKRSAEEFKSGAQLSKMQRSGQKPSPGDIKRLRGLAGTGRAGRLGRLVGARATQGGFLGFLSKAFTKIAPSILRFSSLLTKLATGPIGWITAGLTVASSLISSFNDYQGQYNDAVKEGNAAKAQELAVLKNVSGLTQGIDALGEALGFGGFAEGVQNFKAIFGGDSVEKLKSQAKLDALSSKYDKEKAENAKKASEALQDFANKNISASDALSAISANLVNAGEIKKASAETAAAIRAEKGNNAAFGFLSLRNIGTVGGLFGETTGERDKRLEEEAKAVEKQGKELNDQEFNDFRQNVVPLSKSAIIASKGFEQFINSQKGLKESLSTEQLELLKKDYENQSKAIQDNIKFLQSLNFGLRDVSANAEAASIALNNLVASSETGYNPFESSLSILEASLTSTALALDPSDVANAQKNLADTLRGYGATEQQVQSSLNSVTGLNKAQVGASNALEKLKNDITSGVSAEALKDNFEKYLSGSLDGVDEATKRRIVDSLDIDLGDADILAQVQSGNFSGLIQKAFDPLAKAINEEALGPLKKRAEQEKQLVDLTKRRIDLESAAITARKQAIDIEMEAANLIQEFGGPAVSSSQSREALNRQLNLDLGAAGIGSVSSGASVQEIATAQADILQRFSSLQERQNASIATTGAGAFGGVQGVNEDMRSRLESAQQSILEYSRKRVDQIKKEIDLANKKIELEQNAIQKLIGGDVQGFIEDQSASAAASLLKSGNVALAKTFGPQALSKALENLRSRSGAGGDVSQKQLLTASQAALGSIGIQDQRSAQILAGTSPEIERLKQEGRNISGVLQQAGSNLADISEMSVQAQEVLINAAQVKMQESASGLTQSNLTRGTIASPFSNGGLIYASRGMFIPRGTDTVPAMLTPGEFVVNRRAVQSGNNLQMLKAMNGGATVSSGGSGMARGGRVGYYQNGGMVDNISETISNLSGTLRPIFDQFSESVKQLQNIKLSVKLDTTNVNVNFNGASFLATLSEDIRTQVLKEVKNEITNKLEIGNDGKARFKEGIV